MGLLIKLQDGDTSLKSLKLVTDRPGGGSSGQPYIKNPIDRPDLPVLNSDFLLRGGISAPLNALEDVVRLTKYFFDFRNPSGLLFTAKQNLLSRVSPKTEASRGIGYAGGLINAGVYTPLSTIAEAGVVAFGGHLNKQGIDPTGLIPSLSVNKYQDIIISNQFTGRIDLENNRLVKLTQNITQNEASGLAYVKNYFLNAGNSIISYGGGSDSILGIGNTNIRFATDNAGVSIKTLFPSFDPKTYQAEGKPASSIESNKFQIPVKATEAYIYALPNVDLTSLENSGQYLVSEGRNSYQYNFNTSVYKESGSLEPRTDVDLTTYLTKDYSIISRSSGSVRYFSPINEKLRSFGRQLVTDSVYQKDSGYYEATDPSGSAVLGRYSSKNTLATDSRLIGTDDEAKINILNNSPNITGYLANLNKNAGTYLDKDGNTIVKNNNPLRKGGGRGISVDFRKVNRDVRGFYDDPNSYDYISKPSEYNENTTLDSKVYYDSAENKRKSKSLLSDKNDLIDFSFRVIDPRNPSITITNPQTRRQTKTSTTDVAVLLDFRAYIDSFSDSYSNEWKSQTYMGRAEKQYKYSSFDRSISLGFTVVAENEEHLDQMYRQLNVLASTIAPAYTSQGYMTGVLHQLRVGNYIWDQWGILQGLTYEITDESPWGIDIPKQLPYYIKVTGVNFTPIHNFRPQAILTKEDGIDGILPGPINPDKTNKLPGMKQRYIYQENGGKPN
jgi:hypothetical protein